MTREQFVKSQVRDIKNAMLGDIPKNGVVSNINLTTAGVEKLFHDIEVVIQESIDFGWSLYQKNQ